MLRAHSLPLILRFSYGLVSQQIPWGFSSRWSYLPSLNSSWLTSLFQSSLAKSSRVVSSSKGHSKQSLALASSERPFGFNSRILASRVEVQCSGIYQFLIRGFNSKSDVFSLTLYSDFRKLNYRAFLIWTQLRHDFILSFKCYWVVGLTNHWIICTDTYVCVCRRVEAWGQPQLLFSLSRKVLRCIIISVCGHTCHDRHEVIGQLCEVGFLLPPLHGF